MNFASIQSMARKALGIPHELAWCQLPLCRECQYGKAKQHSVQNPHHIGECPLQPGEMCCVDQMITGCPGLPYTMWGHWSQWQYTTCTFFVDIATRFIFPHFQESTNAMETLQGKQHYEQYCQWYNCTVQEYCSDNGIFTDQQFTEDLAQHGQQQTVAGPGAHHMNGIVERCIGFISTWTLTMLLHAQARWPQVITKAFWPFAMHHAVNIYIHCYRGSSGTVIPPFEEFTGTTTLLQIQDLHPWGCPVYVLDKWLQDGNATTSKWDPHAWLGVYVGHSTIHSSNIVLAYNPVTGHTTPQFHVVFDDYSQTVTPNFSSLPSNTVNDLFEMLWTTSQWTYAGNIPPQYLFHETPDLPNTYDNSESSNQFLQDSQLATDFNEESYFEYYITGTNQIQQPPPDQTSTSGTLHWPSDQTSTSGILHRLSDQMSTSDTPHRLSDQMSTSDIEQQQSHHQNELQPEQPGQPSTYGMPMSPSHQMQLHSQNTTVPIPPAAVEITVPTPVPDSSHHIITQTQSKPSVERHDDKPTDTSPLCSLPLPSPATPTTSISRQAKWCRTAKHKTPENQHKRQTQQLIWQQLLPNFTAVLSAYHNEQTFTDDLTNHQVDTQIDTWLTHSDPQDVNGNSSDPASTMLAELDSILQSFPHIQPNDILQNLPALNPLSFLALNNALPSLKSNVKSNGQSRLPCCWRGWTSRPYWHAHMEIQKNLYTTT